MKYELVNPSDKIYLHADDERVAIAAVLVLSTLYGITDTKGNLIMPVLRFGGMDEFLTDKFGSRAGAQSFIAGNLLKMADCLDSFGTDGERTSLNDICARAKIVANALREKHSTEDANAT